MAELADARDSKSRVPRDVWVRLPPAAFMRPLAERRIVAFLAAGDINASQIADITGVPRSTVQNWLRKPEPTFGRPLSLDLEALPRREYSYLLGVYLGDGTITRHPRNVYRLTVVMDSQYPGIIAECVAGMRAVMPKNRVLVQHRRYRAVEISCYSKLWPLLFPQHGPGRKHERKIELAPWQAEIVERHPRELLRGLIHSDGCRVLNRVNGKDYPRYFFTQVSDDIRRLFCETCKRPRDRVHAQRSAERVDRPRRECRAPRLVRRSEGVALGTASSRTAPPGRFDEIQVALGDAKPDTWRHAEGNGVTAIGPLT